MEHAHIKLGGNSEPDKKAEYIDIKDLDPHMIRYKFKVKSDKYGWVSADGRIIKFDTNGVYIVGRDENFKFKSGCEKTFIPFERILSMKPIRMPRSSVLFAFASMTGYNKKIKDRKAYIKKVFTYANKHGYDVAFKFYYHIKFENNRLYHL